MDKNRKPKFGIWYRAGAMVLVSLGMVYSDYVLSQTVGTIEPRSSSTRRNTSPGSMPSTDGVVSGFYPSLSVSVARQKNVLRSSGKQESDTVVTISPSILYGLEAGSYDLKVRYRTDLYAFSKFSNEDSNNHQIDGNLILDLTNKIDVSLGASYIEGSEFRGQLGSRLFVGATPDKFNETSYDVGTIIGRRDSTLQLAVKAGASRLRYTNNNQQIRDRDSGYIRGSVIYNIGAVTSLNLNVAQTDVDYLEVGTQGNLDGVETSIGLGARWAPTEATRFRVDVGNTKRKFDDPSQSDFSGVTYAGRVIWQPVEYSTVSIFGSHSVEETTDLESSYIVGDLYGIDWRHALTDIWTVNAYYEQGTDDFNIGRRDQVAEFGGGLFYNWFNWLSIGIQYANTKRDSSLNAADFNDEVVYLTFTTNFNVGG
ncbi:MAG TPA: hypothetical protein ENI80_10365 [Acidiferrobacteraceae bacterium]|nr:hypothetical protein [Acidiferrobacteraceae bacterium]